MAAQHSRGSAPPSATKRTHSHTQTLHRSETTYLLFDRFGSLVFRRSRSCFCGHKHTGGQHEGRDPGPRLAFEPGTRTLAAARLYPSVFNPLRPETRGARRTRPAVPSQAGLHRHRKTDHNPAILRAAKGKRLAGARAFPRTKRAAPPGHKIKIITTSTNKPPPPPRGARGGWRTPIAHR